MSITLVLNRSCWSERRAHDDGSNGRTTKPDPFRPSSEPQSRPSSIKPPIHGDGNLIRRDLVAALEGLKVHLVARRLELSGEGLSRSIVRQDSVVSSVRNINLWLTNGGARGGEAW